MIFEKHFETLMQRLDRCLACILMGFDGLKVVSMAKPGIGLDLELMGAEIAAIVNQLRRAGFTDQFGEAREFVFRSGRTTLFLKTLSPEYFVALVLEPDIPVGKAQFLLNVIEPELLRELG